MISIAQLAAFALNLVVKLPMFAPDDPKCLYIAAPHYQGEQVSPGAFSDREVNVEKCSSDSTASSGDAFPARHWHNAADERPLPALLKKQTNNSNPEAMRYTPDYMGSDNSPYSREQRSPTIEESEQKVSQTTLLQAAAAIDVVGLPLVSHLCRVTPYMNNVQ